MRHIADSYGDKCIEHALSVMRLALGYNDGLPLTWPCQLPIMDYKILDSLPDVFPSHEVKVWHSDNGFFNGIRSSHWEYMGNEYKSTYGGWLTAFCYESPDKESGHMVIGEPVTYGLLKIGLIVSVRYGKEKEANLESF